MKAIHIRESPGPIPVIGHRGACAHGPENTIPAFAAAQAQGASWVEVDVKITRDDDFVLMHDPTVNRTTDGEGRVEDLTMEQFQSLDAGSWYRSEFCGTAVPSLQDLLDWSAAGGCGVCLHVDPTFDADTLGRVAELVIVTGEAHRGLVISSSFDQLRWVRDACDQISTGILYPAGQNDTLRHSLEEGVDFLHPHRKTVTAAMINEAHKAGLPVVSCIDPDAELIRSRFEWGLDVFSCDDPALVFRAIES
ncbi:MAG: hypothetical protein HN559_06725 [Gemmatimonadetes bacterium]|nr:hypothetical protein [Gemmatimonadota bacterium]